MMKYLILVCALSTSIFGADRFFLVENIDYEIERLAEAAQLMQCHRPQLKLDAVLYASGLVECQQLVRSTQSIAPVLYWWDVFRKGKQKGDLFVLKELLKLIFLIYKDYLIHLYGVSNEGFGQQLMNELNHAVQAAESAEQLISVLDICYKQLMQLIGQAHSHEISHHPWPLYVMPLAVFIIALLEKIVQVGYFASLPKDG